MYHNGVGWSEPDEDFFGQLKVYGNGNLKLHQPLLSLSARDNYDNQLWPTFYIDGNQYNTGSLNLAGVSRSFEVSSETGYTFNHFHFDFGGGLIADYYYHPVDRSITADCNLTVYYQQNPRYDLTISSSGSGDTDPNGVQQYLEGTYAHVRAVPDSGWGFDYWLLDDVEVSDKPIMDLYMGADHELQAVFREATYYWLTVDAYDYYYTAVYPTVYVDEQAVGTAPQYVYVPEGWHYIAVDNPVGSNVFFYFSSDFGGAYQNPLEIYVNADGLATAWYYP